MKTPNQADINSTIKALKKGGVVVMPTDTVYGLVCLFSLDNPVRKVNLVKERSGKLGTIIASSIEQISLLGVDTSLINDNWQDYWPGPNSILLPLPKNLQHLSPNNGLGAFRVPDLAWLIELLEQTGPLMTTSANLSGQPVCTSITQAKNTFGNKIDFYLDGGDFSGHQNSSVIKIDPTTQQATKLR